jgi:DNA-binding CsgD family transcriptional regulator
VTRPLTPREADALRYATRGLNAALIARRLGTTTSAASAALRRAIRKLGATNLDEAIQLANQPTGDQQ